MLLLAFLERQQDAIPQPLQVRRAACRPRAGART